MLPSAFQGVFSAFGSFLRSLSARSVFLMRLWEKRGVANSIGRPAKDLTIFSVAAPQSRMAAALQSRAATGDIS